MHEGGRTDGSVARRSDWREQLALVVVLAKREIRDTLRDWRLVIPIALLTVIFPVILNFGVRIMMAYLRRYNAGLISTQAIPFMLLVIGFFPISFSLVIALETFAGEKERKSLEPLLATPLSSTQLYLGKTLAALLPPVVASLVGMGIYLLSLYLSMQYRPSLVLVFQILSLTIAEAMVMVSSAVIISSQTTSVRAANLLASFVILPVAFLVQGEALLLFWSLGETLWFVLLALLVCETLLVRMGIRIFNREEFLGREIDTLDLRRNWQLFRSFLSEPMSEGEPQLRRAGPQRRGMWSHLTAFYGRDLSRLLRIQRDPILVVVLSLVGAALLGGVLAWRHPFPTGSLRLGDITTESFGGFEGSALFPAFSASSVFTHNLRSLLLAAGLAIFTFGSFAVVLLMAPIAILGFMAAQVGIAGYNPVLFLAVFVLPHGILELPAATLATAAALRLGLSVVAPPPGMAVSQNWLQALAHFIKLFLLVVVPLLALAAVVEIYVTPALVVAVY
jgi:uncharacterized membrane protein SpoIIM required for sporulation/ABC-type transport system involved in multi-copper enzyme maturation permease subunit